MTKIKKGLLPKFEIVIIGVFFFSFIIWAMSKCGDIKKATQDKLAEDKVTEAEVSKKDSFSDENINTLVVRDTLISKKDTIYITKEAKSTKTYGRLYITINNLKLRTGPNLGDTIITQLPLFEEVEFMNEVTDSIYEINLGYQLAQEPWVKIRTKKGKEGWVYGAGVHYYKKKREGVLE